MNIFVDSSCSTPLYMYIRPIFCKVFLEHVINKKEMSYQLTIFMKF